MKAIDLRGQRFGRLTVVELASPSPSGPRRWLCRCCCGGTATSTTGSLRKGASQSCGCLRNEKSAARCWKHGGIGTREWNCYQHMMRRCGDKDNPSWHRYGARGIRVCDRWRAGFDNFLADMGPCLPGLTLERIDNDGNYDPENCRWATRAEQSRNTTRSVKITVAGETMVAKDWAYRLGVSYGTLMSKIRRGMPPEAAVTEMARRRASS